MNESFSKTECQHCKNQIEFDASQLEPGENRTIECPHCHIETVISIPAIAPPEPPKQTIRPIITPYKYPENIRKADNKKNRVSLLQIASCVLFLIGGALVFTGCGGDLGESLKSEGSAIRQTVYTVQYVGGFILIGLSVAIGALTRIIQNQ